MNRHQRKARQEAAQRRAALRFNRDCPVGAEVRMWAGMVGVGPGVVCRVLAPGAHVVSGRGAVVLVTGVRGAVSLTQVRDAKSDVASSFDS